MLFAARKAVRCSSSSTLAALYGVLCASPNLRVWELISMATRRAAAKNLNELAALTHLNSGSNKPEGRYAGTGVEFCWSGG